MWAGLEFPLIGYNIMYKEFYVTSIFLCLFISPTLSLGSRFLDCVRLCVCVCVCVFVCVFAETHTYVWEP